MNPIQRISTLEQSGATEQKQFSMQTSKKMFQILSGLYSDTILAIVRELSTNCIDSHVAAGKKSVPFHVHLPNTLEPWLIIQDFGTGIPHDAIYSVYAVYGASTKENSNDYVGMLGLGSKSFFAYTDNAMVTSIVNGTKRIYSAYFSEQGTPAIALMSTEATTESNGLAIQIPVKEDDFDRFRNATQNALRFFATKPTVSGGTVDWKEDTCTFHGNGWKSYSSFNHGESYAVMGGVAYPIDYYKVSSDNCELVKRGGLVIEFEMGSLDFTPSRESLEYGDVTTKALNDKLTFIGEDFIGEDFIAKISETIKDKPDLYEALKAVTILNKNFAFLSNKIKKDAYVWNGLDISSPHLYLKRILANVVNGYYRHYYYDNYRRKKIRYSEELIFDEVWYRDDMARGGENRVKHNVKMTRIPCVYIPDATYQALVAAGIPATSFVNASSLPKQVRVGSVGGGVPMEIKVYRNSGYWRKPWESEVFDPAEPPKFYIVKDSGAGMSFPSIHHPSLTGNIYDRDGIAAFLAYANLSKDECVLVSHRNEKHLIAAGSIKFEDWLTDLLDNKIVMPDEDSLAISSTYDRHKDEYTTITKKDAFKNLDDSNLLKQHVNRVNQAFNEVKAISGILSRLKVKNNVKTTVEKIDCPVLKLLIEKIGYWENTEILTLATMLNEKN